MKNCNMILKEKQQQYQNYRPEKLINMTILQVKKKSDIKSYVYSLSIRKSFRKTNKNNWELREKKQIKAIEDHGK